MSPRTGQLLTRRGIALPSYLFLTAGVLAASLLVVRSASFSQHPDLLALAVALDVTVLIPALYLVFARFRGWPWITVVPIFVLSLIALKIILPEGHERLLLTVDLAAVPLELSVVGYLLFRGRQLMKDYKSRRAESGGFIECMEAVLSPVLKSRAAVQVFTTEASTLYYGLFAWGKRPGVEGGGRAFSYHTRNSHAALIGVFGFLIVIETGGIHLLLSLWNPKVAWVFSALSLYALIFLLADFNASRRRPVLVTGSTLELRAGLRWRASIPLDAVSSANAVSEKPEGGKKFLKANLFGSPNVLVTLETPVQVTGVYGITKDVRALGLHLDDPEAFLSALRSS